jgi:cytochrome c-type biogenesis protein CcmH
VTSRRAFLVEMGGVALGAIAVSARARAQEPGAFHPAGRGHTPSADTTNLFVMNQDAYRPVHMPPKTGVPPQLDDEEIVAIERRLHCPCGCTLDVYTCRTSLFECQVAPEMHRDVLDLVAGGYGAEEIVDEFVNVYGTGVLMTPPTEGVTLLAWVAPVMIFAIGAAAVVAELRRWRAAPSSAAAGDA